MKRSILLGVLLAALIISLFNVALAEGGFSPKSLNVSKDEGTEVKDDEITTELIITISPIMAPAGDPNSKEDDIVIYQVKENEVVITTFENMNDDQVAICNEIGTKEKLLANAKNLPNVVKEVAKDKAVDDYRTWEIAEVEFLGDALRTILQDDSYYMDINFNFVGEDGYDDKLVVIRYDYRKERWSTMDPEDLVHESDGSVTLRVRDPKCIYDFREPVTIMASHSATYNGTPSVSYASVMQHIVENKEYYDDDESVYEIVADDIGVMAAADMDEQALEVYDYLAKKRTMEELAPNLQYIINKVEPGNVPDDFIIRDVLDIDVSGDTLAELKLNENRYINVNFDFFNKYDPKAPLVVVKYVYDTQQWVALEPWMYVVEDDGSITIRITDNQCFLSMLVEKP